MFYIKSRAEAEEAIDLYTRFKVRLPYFVTPRIVEETGLELENLWIENQGEEILLLNPKTATWCYVDGEEYKLCQKLKSKTKFADLVLGAEPSFSENLKRLLIQMFRMALLKIDGETGIDENIYKRGPLFSRAYLIELLLTEKCNLACPYCFSEAGMNGKDMPLEIAYIAVDKALELPEDKFIIEFGGGETLTRFHDFAKVILYIEEKAKKNGKEVSIVVQSNGTLINDEVAEFIKNHDIIEVGISIDGTQGLNHRTRHFLNGRSSHEKTLIGLNKLKEHVKKVITTITVVNKYNCDNPDDILEHFASLDLYHVWFNPILRLGRADSNWEEVGITPEQYFLFMKGVLNYISNNLCFSEENLENMMRNLTVRTRDFRCMRSPCGAGYDYIVINPAGDLYPCAHHPNKKELCLGNIKDIESLDMCFLNSPVVKKMADRIVDNLAECYNCPWRHFCEGGCALDAYTRYGNLDRRTPMCEFFQLMYPYLINYMFKKSDIINHFVPEAMICRLMSDEKIKEDQETCSI